MSRPRKLFNYDLYDDKSKVWADLSEFNKSVYDILFNGILFSDNFDISLRNVTITTANVEFSVLHGLERIPVGYLLISSSASINLYDGDTAWTKESIYLKGSATGSGKVYIF